MRISNLTITLEHHLEFVVTHDGCPIRHTIRADVPDSKIREESQRLQKELIDRVYAEHAESEVA